MTSMACNVYVLTEEGEALLLEAGSTPPEWALPQLGEHALTKSGESESPGGDDDESDDESDIPPVKGPGSSAKAWAAYALTKGFEVDTDAKASEIRDALAEAGIPVE